MIQFSENINWLLPLIAGSFGLAFFLYFYRPDGYSKRVNIFLFLIRFIVFLLIGMFLLDPIIKYKSTEEEKPIFIIALDQSQSLVANDDSITVKKSIKSIINTIKNKDDVSLEMVKFGADVTHNIEDTVFDQTNTNISKGLTYLNNNYGYRNVAGVLLISDGIYNEGLNPIYNDFKINTPIDVIALGDTSHKMDQKIDEVRYNKIVYLNNRFPIKVSIEANELKGKKSRVSVFQKNAETIYKSVNYDSNNDFITLDFELEATKIGTQLITIFITSIEGETNTLNNKIVIPIEVLNSKEQIALIYQTLSPDIGAIKQSLTKNENSSLDLIRLSEVNEDLYNDLKNKYNALIMYQIPSVKSNTSFNKLKQLFLADIPKMYVVGTNTDLNQFTKLNPNFILKNSSNFRFNETTPWLNTNFNTFRIPKESNNIISSFPPTFSPFAEFKIKGKTTPILNQTIGTIKSDIPLWALNEFNETNSVYVFATDFWKWNLAEYKNFEQHQFFDNLIEKSLSFLTVKKDKSKLRLYSKTVFSSEENIILNAELYNDLYEPINEPPVELKLIYNDSISYDYVFDRNSLHYDLNLGKMIPGSYKCIAKTKYNGKELIKKRLFSVFEQKLELMNLEANHNLLSKIADRTGGRLYYANQQKDWKKTVEEKSFSSTLYEQINFKNLIDIKWFFVAIIALLGLEWLIRKREGFL